MFLGNHNNPTFPNYLAQNQQEQQESDKPTEPPLLTFPALCRITAQTEHLEIKVKLSIYSDDYHLEANEGAFDICVQYDKTGSLGTNGNVLIVFYGQEEEEEEEEGEEGEYEGEEGEGISVGDELVKMMRESSGRGNYFMRGSCMIDLIFEQVEIMQAVYSKMSDILGELDQGNSEYKQDSNNELEEMISADNIDQNGNIVFNENEEGESQGSEMVDEKDENI